MASCPSSSPRGKMPHETSMKFAEMAAVAALDGAGDVSPGASSWQHPPSFYCPISQQCMHDPVVLSDGHTYERRHIERWLQDHVTSPVSNEPLTQKFLFPNHALRNSIEEYFEQVFSIHRRAIRKSIKNPAALQNNSGCNEQLLHTIDALMQCSLLVNADLNTECVLRQIMAEAKALLSADVASVFLVDPTKQELYSTVNSTNGELRIPINAGIAGHVATTGEPLIINDVYADERFDKTNDIKTGFRTCNMMCAPLKIKKAEVIGVVQLINKTRGASSEEKADSLEVSAPSPIPFTAHDLQFFEVFASQAAIAVVNSGGVLRELVLGTNDEGDSTHAGAKSCIARPLRKLGKEADFPWKDDSMQADIGISIPSLASSQSRGLECEFVELSSTSVLGDTNSEEVQDIVSKAVDEWQIDAFLLTKFTNNKPLSTLAVHLFQKYRFIDNFGLDITKVRNFFTQIECGYDVHPYHNREHAASVLHAVHALLTEGRIAELAFTDVESAECGSCEDGQLEMMACLFAAAVHDFEHLGVSNEFLIRSCDRRAMTYNDQHVNEHHHLAAAFAVLQKPECNFLESLSYVDFKRFRSLVIELVLGTDMASNGKILKSFNDTFGVVADAGSATKVKPASAKESVLLLQFALKCADLGHLALSWDIHKKWVSRLEEEFFAQGDRECALGHPVSFLMDRNKPGCSQTQVGFFDFVVFPIFRSLVAVAPATQPLLDGVTSNYEAWKTQEMSAAKAQERNGKEETKSGQIDEEKSSEEKDRCSVASETDTCIADGSQQGFRKRSGRARQRAAKWWAAVRAHTPSPESRSELSPRPFVSSSSV